MLSIILEAAAIYQLDEEGCDNCMEYVVQGQSPTPHCVCLQNITLQKLG